MADSFFFDDFSMSKLFLYILLYMGTFVLTILLAVFFFTKYSQAQSAEANERIMKKCFSCGGDMKVAESSCPKCSALQPPDNSPRGK
jgi:hypothetical protein